MWAGGKTRLLKHYGPVWPAMGDFDSYVEPFLGGGAVYGWLQERPTQLSSHLNDCNRELMGVYEAVKTDLQKFTTDVDKLIHAYLPLSKESRKAWYYELRESYWETQEAAVLYMLMRTGFNGIWQTNRASQGLFATPAGLLNHQRPAQIYRTELLELWSKSLATATLSSESYENLTFEPARSLIYLDPPYRDSFTTYGTGFGDEDQRRLLAWAMAKREQGATVLLANRVVEGDSFFEELVEARGSFTYFDVTYTAGRRKKTPGGFQAKPAREFLLQLKPA